MPKLPQGMRRKENGMIEYRFQVNGRTLSVTATSVSECKEKASQRLSRLHNGLVDSSKITFLEYYNEWLQNHTSIKQSTKYCYEITIKPVLPYIGKMRIVDIERRHIVDTIQKLNPKYADSTMQKLIVVLKIIFDSAIVDRIINFNPVVKIEYKKNESDPDKVKSVRALTKEEQSEFFKYAKSTWYYELLAVLVLTGMRIGEAGALTWKDVDFKNKIIHITKTVTKVGAAEWSIGTPKSRKGFRNIPMSDDCKNILLAQRKKIFEHTGKYDYVFKSLQTYRPITDYSGSYAIDVVLEAMENDGINIEHFSPHALRDTFATRFIEQGGQMDTLRDILGHASIAMTMDRYAHVLPDRKKAQIDMLKISI